MMSIAQLSHRSSVGTKRMTNRVPDVTKRPQRPERTHISQYEYGAKDNTNLIDERSFSNIIPTDTAAMSEEMLNQYNNLIEAEESLAFKPLPPVKISYHSTKNKFMESARGDTSSRIIRPHLSVKTHSPGHHIFTEGISKNSIVRSPTFALQKVGVPYSNLPDNISIHKEKDKFAFGVKREEYEKSPYRLTPKPFKAGNAVFITKIETDKSSVVSNEKFLKAKAGGAKANAQSRPSLEIRSNVIKLKPLTNMDGKPEFGPEYIKVPTLPLGPSIPPMAPRNSIHRMDTGEMKLPIKVEINHKPKSTGDRREQLRDRKLSVVSIGESIEPNFYGNTKRETRQLYPMYDHKSRMNEHYKRQMFEYTDPEAVHSMPKLPSSTFTYKVSTRAMSFIQDNSPDKFKPIKNNLTDSQGNLIHKQRGYRMTSSLEDLTKSNNSDYNFRKYYRRVFRRPKSSDTFGSDVSLVPGNPPPSEISHIFSEDAPLLINDLRNEMLPLFEERTMTGSVLSPRKGNTPMLSMAVKYDTPPNTKQGNANEGIETDRSQRTYLEEIQTCTDTDIQFENAVLALERSNGVETGMSVNMSSLDTARNIKTDTDSPLKRQSPVETITENKDTKDNTTNNATVNSTDIEHIDDISKSSKSANSVNETSRSANNEASVLEYIAEGEQRVKEHTLSVSEHTLSVSSERAEIEDVVEDMVVKLSKCENIEEQQTTNKGSKKIHLPKIKSAGCKPLLSVPKLSLDSAANHPALDMRKERTSLSRTLQSLTCAENKLSPSVTNNGNYSLKLDIEKSGEVSLKRTHVPVTRLRLFSDKSSISTNGSEVENDTLYEALGLEVNIGGTSSRSTDHQHSERKLVNNANVSFIYPSTEEIKAKRQ